MKKVIKLIRAGGRVLTENDKKSPPGPICHGVNGSTTR